MEKTDETLVINNYQTVFYNGLGITGRLPLLLVGCFNFVTVPGNLISGLLVDHFGRRKFFLCGAASLCVVLCVECALTARFADTGSSNKVGLGFGVAFIFMFPVFYSLFLDATMYLVSNGLLTWWLAGPSLLNFLCAYTDI